MSLSFRLLSVPLVVFKEIIDFMTIGQM
ncbi:hypothetical protein CRE_21787 [Caenorhabditis remanei]|uniref:Uncharacterized protein n=1 Tax=Caenorhabditis remanei TaxID=31234 RepID=E3MEG4_CAERE|nr:hypothetical protein CRE_21787 [Caenorhabditis remanei]